MERKYELTDETMEWKGRILYRIRALRDFSHVAKGELGGWVEHEGNLSHNGNCWVNWEAKAFGKSRIYDNGEIFGSVEVFDNAEVCRNSNVFDNAIICGYADVCGNAYVCDSSYVSGNVVLSGNVIVKENAKLCGDVDLDSVHKIGLDADISSLDDIFLIGNIGSRYGFTTFYKGTGEKIMVSCGCFNGTIEKFEKKVQKVHKGNKYEKEYKIAIELAKIHIKLKGE